MSHYNKVKTKLNNPEFIIAALAEMGLTGFKFPQGMPLKGYQGDERQQMAHIIVPGRTREYGMGDYSNDLGFCRQADGTYSLIISDFDEGYLRRPNGQSFGDAFRLQYGRVAVQQSMPGMVISNVETLADGSIRCAFEVEAQPEFAQNSVGI